MAWPAKFGVLLLLAETEVGNTEHTSRLRRSWLPVQVDQALPAAGGARGNQDAVPQPGRVGDGLVQLLQEHRGTST